MRRSAPIAINVAKAVTRTATISSLRGKQLKDAAVAVAMPTKVTPPQTTEPMPLACVRVIRICALLAFPATAFAQSSRSPTIFSPSQQMGTVNVRAAVESFGNPAI